MKLIFAYSLMLIGVYMLWQVLLVGASVLALVALIFAVRRRARGLAIVALVTSFAPFAVPLSSTSLLTKYGSADKEPTVLFGLTMLPPLISLIAVYISKKPMSDPRP